MKKIIGLLVLVLALILVACEVVPDNQPAEEPSTEAVE
jgi:starvation-inducible outer membrane lipoprotein|tara:strand:+ start:116 stop:229 length:114 start_codon:yes stop_codon:yes gene_type:complete